MSTAKLVDNLIIGTGPSAVAAAMALRRLGAKFEVVDVGFDLETERETRVDKLARQSPDSWSEEDREVLFPPPKTSTNGVEKRLAFGSDFTYRVPAILDLKAENCVVDVSHGFGGFGNVWGAAVLPFADNDLAGWPFSAAELSPSYRNVAAYVPISGVADDLERFFPRFGGNGRGLLASSQIQGLARALGRRNPALQKRGIWVGRSRVAVDSSGGPTTCRYCGYCLDGCAYGSIFNPRRLWKQLEGEGVVIHRGLYASEFDERPDGVDLVTVDVTTGLTRVLHTRRLFLGTGALSSTRIVARSLRLHGKPIPLKDSQYFFFPFLSYRKAPEAPSFTLAELFVEVLNPALGPYFTHFQVYGLNSIFRKTLRAMIPSRLAHPALLDQLEKRFFLFQGFLHSDFSGRLELTLERTGTTKDCLKIRGINNPASLSVARRAKRLIQKELMPYGLVPPFSLKMIPLGRSFHMGGSFPMGGSDPLFRSDRLGRPAGLRRVHLLDASTFPTIPATTISFSIMANSDRIVGEMHGRSE